MVDNTLPVSFQMDLLCRFCLLFYDISLSKSQCQCHSVTPTVSLCDAFLGGLVIYGIVGDHTDSHLRTFTQLLHSSGAVTATLFSLQIESSDTCAAPALSRAARWQAFFLPSFRAFRLHLPAPNFQTTWLRIHQRRKKGSSIRWWTTLRMPVALLLTGLARLETWLLAVLNLLEALLEMLQARLWTLGRLVAIDSAAACPSTMSPTPTFSAERRRFRQWCGRGLLHSQHARLGQGFFPRRYHCISPPCTCSCVAVMLRSGKGRSGRGSRKSLRGLSPCSRLFLIRGLNVFVLTLFT